MLRINGQCGRPVIAASIFLASFGLVSVSNAQTTGEEQQFPDPIPGSASALVFNQLFNVGGIGVDNNATGSVGCGGGGGTVLSNTLNAAEPGQQVADRIVAESGDRDEARNLWRFCDNMFEQITPGGWTIFVIDPEAERLQSAGMAPDELFAQIDQAAAITRSQIRSVGSRAKQMRLAALGYENESKLAANGAMSLDVSDGGLQLNFGTGLNAGDIPGSDLGSRLSIWANLRHVDVEADTSPAEIGSKTDGFGAVIGFDYLFNDKFFGGVSLSLTDLDSEFDRIMGSPTGASQVKNTALQFIYSYFPNDRFYLNGVVGVSNLEFDNTKYVPTFDMGQGGAGVFAPLDSSPDGDTKFTNLMLGWDLRKQSAIISPYFRVEYLDTGIDGFVERSREEADNTLSLTVFGQSNTSVTGTIGTQFSFPRSTGSGVWAPYLRAELVKEFQDQADSLSGFLTIIPDAKFVLAPTKTDEEYAYFGLGVSGQMANGWAFFADYDALAGFDNLSSWQATFGFRKEL